MNLSQVNSPVDLILENEKPAKPIDKINSQIKHCSPSELLGLTQDLTQILIEFHEYVIDSKNEADLNPGWFVDARALHFALKILQTVDL